VEIKQAHSLSLGLRNKLVMTPQLQQVIKLLQLPTVELVDLVRTELEANPMLEEGDDEGATPSAEASDDSRESEESMDAWLALAAEEGPREKRDTDREDYLEQVRENSLVNTATLQDYLTDQLRLLEADPEDVRLAEFLAGNLDDSGYLATPLADLEKTAGADVDRLERALTLLQMLDPPGVGARDLKECILLQLREMAEDTSLARRIASERLEELSDGAAAVERLATELGAAIPEIVSAIRQIKSCDPRPGGRFAEPPQAVFPDARVEMVDGEYVISLNDNGLPPIRLSAAYRELMAKRSTLGEEERRFLQERFRSALMLMRGIEQRRVTLYKTVEHVVRTQRNFLDLGPAQLKPLTLRVVADAIGVHESTVSRVVANKYVATPRGIFALKYFFSNRLPAATVAGMSGTAVRERIRGLISGEDSVVPFSDEALAVRLKQEGITIARRTVTKYREALKLPPAWQRKNGAENGKGAKQDK
jgi:RNA polymerase sigma-54 factor